MSSQPFPYTPDTFLLQLQGSTENFSTRAYESHWGETDEELCYFDGVLIGLLLSHHLPQDNSSTISVRLLPKLDRQRAYEWPEANSFGTALMAILTSSQRWQLRCERDTDQAVVPLIANQEMLREALTNVLSFCAGASLTCPSFVARGGAFVPNNAFQPTPSARLN